MPKVDLPSSTKRESTRSLRKPCHTHCIHAYPITIILRKGPPMGPVYVREHCHSRWLNEGPRQRSGFSPLRFSRPSINRLATSLGIDESLAFRAFDKTIIFGHWLSKTQKLALASGAFLLKKASTIS